jgi:hypothetical protein
VRERPLIPQYSYSLTPQYPSVRFGTEIFFCGIGDFNTRKMFIRRLNVDEDYELYKEVYEWEKDYPRWLQDAEKVARLGFDKFIEQTKDRADIGVFDPEFIAMISVLKRAPQIYEGHVWAKRGTDIEQLAWVVFNLRKSLEKELGMKACYVWIVEKNLPVKKLCMMAGLVPDGGVLIDGESHGKPIKWVRLSYRRVYGEEKTDFDTERDAERDAEYQLQQHEYV